MRTGTNLPALFALLATPLVAYADPAPSTGHTLSFVASAAGGAVGGFLGALVACWLCHRRNRRDDSDPKKY